MLITPTSRQKGALAAGTPLQCYRLGLLDFLQAKQSHHRTHAAHIPVGGFLPDILQVPSVHGQGLLFRIAHLNFTWAPWQSCQLTSLIVMVLQTV